MPDKPLSIEAFQQHIRRQYYDADSARGTSSTFLWFIEEVGELATALQHAAEHRADTSETKHDLDEEFADVLAWLCTLANINGVNLTDAVHEKYMQGNGPVGHK